MRYIDDMEYDMWEIRDHEWEYAKIDGWDAKIEKYQLNRTKTNMGSSANNRRIQNRLYEFNDLYWHFKYVLSFCMWSNQFTNY